MNISKAVDSLLACFAAASLIKQSITLMLIHYPFEFIFLSYSDASLFDLESIIFCYRRIFLPLSLGAP